MVEFLRDIRVTFAIALILAIVFPGASEYLIGYLLPLIAVSMFFSLVNVECFLPSVSEMKESLKLLLVGYVLLSGVMIIVAQLLPDEDFKNGLIMYAAFPPAVMIVGLSMVWNGKVKMAFVGELMSYIVGLVLTPLITLVFIGSSVPVGKLVELLVFIFILPLLVVGLMRKATAWRCDFAKEAANLLISLVFYIMVAESIRMIADEITGLMFSIALVAVVSLLLMYAIRRVYPNDVNMALFRSLKNGGAAAAASLILLTPGATLFLTARILMDLVLIVMIGQWYSGSKGK